MPSSIETQRSSSPENMLLEKLKSTLTSRWNDFDRQLPAGKSIYPAYRTILSSYEGLMSDLNTTFTDESLRKDAHIQGKIDAFLAQLDKHLQKEDRDKKYDATLTETNRLVSELRNQIYAQTIADAQKRTADLQKDVIASAPKSPTESKQESLPTTVQAAATVTGATGVVAAIESGGKKAEVAAKQIMKPLEKIKKWSSDIGDAWDAGWELVKKGDISKGIGLFFAVLFGGSLKDALAKYAGKKDGDNNKSQESQEGDQNKNKENYMIYYASVGVFQSINKTVLEKYTGSVRSTGDAILRSEQFMNLNFNMVGSLMQNYFKNGAIETNSHLHRYVHANILKPLGYASNQKNYESVQYALLSIYNKNDQSFIGKHISSEFVRFQKENKNATIRQVVEGLSDEIDMVSRFDFSNDASTDDFLTVNPNTKTIEGSGGRFLNSHFSKETLIAFTKNATIRLPMNFDQKSFAIDTSFSGVNMEEVKKLINFRSKIQQNICSNQQFLFGNEKYKQPLQKGFEQMTYYDTMKLYAMVGGKTDVASFGAMRSALVYTQIAALLEHNNDAYGAYFTSILHETSISAGGTSKYIPEGTAAFLSAIVGNVSKSIWDGIENTVEKWWGGMKTNPGTTLTTTFIGGMFLLYTRFFPAKGRNIAGFLTGK